MLGMFRAMMPKEARFFDMFERHAVTLVGGAEVMSRMFAAQIATSVRFFPHR